MISDGTVATFVGSNKTVKIATDGVLRIDSMRK